MSGIIYNVTVNVSEDRVEEWLEWLRGEHIPQMLGIGIFGGATLVRVLGLEQGGKTFAIQYRAESMRDFDRYEQEYATALRTQMVERFGEDAQGFRTVLEIVEDFGNCSVVF
jgi:hypothetical protein